MDIKTLCNNIQNLFNEIRPMLTPIPPPILMVGGLSRPGVSPSLVASNIIRRQSEAGAPFGPNIDGSPNISEAMEVIRIEELVKALKLDGKIEIVIPTGAIVTSGTGANAGGPVIVKSQNIMPVPGYGIIR